MVRVPAPILRIFCEIRDGSESRIGSLSQVTPEALPLDGGLPRCQFSVFKCFWVTSG